MRLGGVRKVSGQWKRGSRKTVWGEKPGAELNGNRSEEVAQQIDDDSDGKSGNGDDEREIIAELVYQINK